ncbi:MAG: ankyrin repeat domain-containing protein [Rhodospirillales bacterium]|nr:ankyrin repeat domain-containing protein [Rhodospirillales bacterium]
MKLHKVQMKRYFIITLVAGLLFAALFSSVFSASAGEREKLASELNAMVADLSCDNNPECRSFGFGDKPCGGFWKYMLYSVRNVDEKMLLRKAEQYKALDEIYNKTQNIGSACDVTQPIHGACIRGQCVSMGDELNYVTPIHYAADQNDSSLIEELLDSGHDINGLSVRNETPLLYAVQNNAVTSKTVEFLIEKGADVNFKYGEKTNTALIYAVTQERPAIVETLLEHKADPYLSNHWGNALDYAVEIKNKQILNMFKTKGYQLKDQ